MISKSHSLKESTPQRRTVRSIEVVTVNSDKRCFSFIYLSVCGTKTSYYSPYGLWEDPGDALVCGPSFVSVTSKVYGCHHVPVNKRWMSHISQLAVWTHRDDSQFLKLTKLFIFINISYLYLYLRVFFFLDLYIMWLNLHRFSQYIVMWGSGKQLAEKHFMENNQPEGKLN